MLSKRKSYAFGKDVYLLGKDEYGDLIWLESPSWDCEWYWGFGYLETYTNNLYPDRSRDIQSHQHFDDFVGFENENGDYVHHINKSPRMSETVLTNDESWELSDLMKQFYILRQATEIFHTGNGHLTSSSKVNNKNPKIEKEINKIILPRIFERVLEILTPPDAEDSIESVGL